MYTLFPDIRNTLVGTYGSQWNYYEFQKTFILIYLQRIDFRFTTFKVQEGDNKRSNFTCDVLSVMSKMNYN